jgi:hypothetical protein
MEITKDLFFIKAGIDDFEKSQKVSGFFTRSLRRGMRPIFSFTSFSLKDSGVALILCIL